ncbi:MAG: sensor histidine kinase [Candidatus Binatia bacterium]
MMPANQKAEWLSLDPAAIDPASVMPLKSTVILIRWPVTLICGYLILYRDDVLAQSSVSGLFAVVYALSNAALYFVREATFRSLAFNIALIVLDTCVLTGSLIVNGQFEPNLFLAYFLLIIICCIFENPKMIAVVSLLAPFAYGGLYYRDGNFHPGAYLQLVFLFIVGIFYGHFSQLVRAQTILRERAEHRSQAKTELLHILSHELKTPLTVIINFAQAMQGKIFGEINADQDQALQKILRQAGNLDQIMNALLDAASIETSALTVRKEEFSLADFVEELKQNYHGVIDNDERSLVWHLLTPLPSVFSDPGKLRIILQNLINNAAKFTEKGEIRVTVSHVSEKNQMFFSVADSGAGIAANHLPFIFEKFWQADGDKIKADGGMGLGLFIVKAFTELLQGTVTVASKRGEGTVFKVTLPAT